MQTPKEASCAYFGCWDLCKSAGVIGVSSIPTAAGFRPIFRRSFEHGIAKVS